MSHDLFGQGPGIEPQSGQSFCFVLASSHGISQATYRLQSSAVFRTCICQQRTEASFCIFGALGMSECLPSWRKRARHVSSALFCHADFDAFAGRSILRQDGQRAEDQDG